VLSLNAVTGLPFQMQGPVNRFNQAVVFAHVPDVAVPDDAHFKFGVAFTHAASSNELNG
jgi:hypothetical protein